MIRILQGELIALIRVANAAVSRAFPIDSLDAEEGQLIALGLLRNSI